MEELAQVTQPVSGRVMIHTQVCLTPQPMFLTMSHDENIRKFCSGELWWGGHTMMAHFALIHHLIGLPEQSG